MYKRVISPGIFSIFFQNFDIQVHEGGEVKMQKMAQISLGISGTIHHMIVIFGAFV